MKRIVSIIICAMLAALCAVAFSACKKADESTPAGTSAAVSESAQPSEPVSISPTEAEVSTSPASTAAGVDSFMGEWIMESDEISQSGVVMKWLMTRSGESIKLTITSSYNNETDTEEHDCTYEYSKGTLVLYSKDFAGGSVMFTMPDGNHLYGTSLSGGAEPVYLHK